jgi:hypothetical protein
LRTICLGWLRTVSWVARITAWDTQPVSLVLDFYAVYHFFTEFFLFLFFSFLRQGHVIKPRLASNPDPPVSTSQVLELQVYHT